MLRKIIPSRVKGLSLCLLSSALLIFSFSACNIWLFAWFAFLPLFFALGNKSKAKAFLLAYLTGVIFWAGTVYWLAHVTLAGTIILVLYLALYFGFFGFIITNYRLLFTNYGFLFIPSVWVLLEYVRAHLFTGFPWALLGYSQYTNLPVIQIADITGVWGVSFLVMMVNVLIVSVVRIPSSVVREKQKYLLPLLCVLFTLIYGYYKIYGIRNTEYGIRAKISVIQPNIPQELKWDAQAAGYILDKYRLLTQGAAAEHPDLIVWPEAAGPGIYGEDIRVFEEVSALAGAVKTPLLLGAVAREGSGYFNRALLFGASGEIKQQYDKLHLVPFGEYIPLRKVLPFLQAVVPIGDMSRGKEYVIFSLEGRERRGEGRKFAVLICFEDLFPELSREFIKRGAQFLVNITNDAWYKKTSAPYQHLQASVFRAVENRVPLARSANTGISAFISASGRIISFVEDEFGQKTFIPGYKSAEMEVTSRPLSFYTRWGDFFILVCIFLVSCGIILRIKNSKARLS